MSRNKLLTFLNGDVCGEVVTDECVVTCGGVQGDKVSLIELKWCGPVSCVGGVGGEGIVGGVSEEEGVLNIPSTQSLIRW